MFSRQIRLKSMMCLQKYGLQERSEDYRVVESELIEWSRPSVLLHSRYTMQRNSSTLWCLSAITLVIRDATAFLLACIRRRNMYNGDKQNPSSFEKLVA